MTVACVASPGNRRCAAQSGVMVSQRGDFGLARLIRHGLHGAMHELVRSNDLVLLGAIEALLASANLDCLIADQHISALEGMTGAFPRRLLVREADRRRARALLVEAGFGGELRPE